MLQKWEYFLCSADLVFLLLLFGLYLHNLHSSPSVLFCFLVSFYWILFISQFLFFRSWSNFGFLPIFFVNYSIQFQISISSNRRQIQKRPISLQQVLPTHSFNKSQVFLNQNQVLCNLDQILHNLNQVPHNLNRKYV